MTEQDNGSLVEENYNSQNLVEIWREFIDWDKRRVGEDGFLTKNLRQNNVKKVFDSSLGDGCDSIYLLKEGFDVTSNEIDNVFLNKARQNALSEEIELNLTYLDWRNLDKELQEGSFDAVICLGNSLTYLFKEKDQLQALEQFKKILRKGGVLIVDGRNYQYILDNKDEILKGNFKYSGDYVYCGDKVHGTPIAIADKKVRIEYKHSETDKKGYLTLYPFKRGELKGLLERAGFSSIKQFSDYKEGENPEADFYQYICIK